MFCDKGSTCCQFCAFEYDCTDEQKQEMKEEVENGYSIYPINIFYKVPSCFQNILTVVN